MSSADSSPRIGYVDVLRGLAVVAVVLGHAVTPGRLTSVLYSYHLALFFFVSGYLYRDGSSLAEDGRRLWRRLRALYVPFVAWNLGYLAFHNLFVRTGLYGAAPGAVGEVPRAYPPLDLAHVAVNTLLLRSTEQMSGALWFLIALIMVTAAFGGVSMLARRIASRPDAAEALRALGVAALFAAGFAGASTTLVPFLGTALVATGIYYAGYLYRRNERRVPVNALAAIAAVGVLYLLRGGVDLGANSYRSLLVLLVAPAAGIYANVYVAKRFADSRALAYVGRHSLFVIATHFLAFKAVTAARIAFAGLPASYLAAFPVADASQGWWAAYLAAGLLLPIGARLALDAALALPARLRPAAASSVESAPEPLVLPLDTPAPETEVESA